ncbi:MAG: [LysW]-aminoadipate/[LysW]-glutamate kinase [Candidatus Bathyarchaeia archaeon]
MIVVKIGGDIIREVTPALVSDLKEVFQNEGGILVHGGGDEVTEVAKRMGKEQLFVVSPEGIRSRYTDEEDIKIFTMVLCGLTNKNLVAILVKGGLKAIGISGADASIIRATRKKKIVILDERNRKRVIDGGFTGKIESVDPEPLMKFVSMGLVPVVSPLAIGEDFELLNIDADMAAAKLAASLIPSKLVFLTDVMGVMKEGEVIKVLRLEEARTLVKEIGFGMNRKLMAAVEAVDSGVCEAIISSGQIENPVTRALAHEVGTIVCP